MEYRICGSLEVFADNGPVAVGGAKPRAVLAVLLLHANEPVSAERLAVALWGEDAAASAVKTIHVHVSRLRRALNDPGLLVTTPAGYQLRVGPGELDAGRFEQLAAEGRRYLAHGAPMRAARVLREALSLWRGPALAEFAFESSVQAEIGRLEEERLAALEARLDADLAVGRHGEVVGELQQLVAVHPLRERLHGLLMLALYRSGRQADALQAYRDARDALVEQLGIEPGPELRKLERGILAHESALDQPILQTAERATAARIPVPATPTIGREGELAALRRALGEREGRLVTVVGPGGVGKTRLVVELARQIGGEFSDGVYFVSLTPVSRHEDVAPTIARQLDVVLLRSETSEQGLARHLVEREALLILDNFEHVLGAATLVADMLAATTDVIVLVTSREPLRLRAERLFRLDPLALPALGSSGDGTSVEQSSAVALFVSVARGRDASFMLDDQNATEVAGVCRRLDGLPLAIELAAARAGLLTVPELAARLREGVGVLGQGSRDAPARQRTLTATIEWSYALLTPDERRTLGALAVFAGGCTIEAAQGVTGASLDALEALVSKNLVVRRTLQDGRTRLTVLETVGEFARDRITEEGDAEEVRRRHAEYYLALAERAAPELERSDSAEACDRLDLEIHNLRAALSWAVDRRAAVPALRLATALRDYWDHRQLEREGARWLRAALALSDDGVPASVRAAALAACAFCLAEPQTNEEARTLARQGLELARSNDDATQCVASLSALAMAALNVHEVEDAYRYATEAERLAREIGDDPKRIAALQLRALMAPTLDEALALGEQAAAGHRREGSYRRLALLQTSLIYTALFHGEFASAQRLDTDALEAAEALGDPLVSSFAYGNHGLVAVLTGDPAGAEEAFSQELQLADRYRYDRMLYEAIGGLAAVAAVRGADELAARLSGAAESTGSDRHDPVIADHLDDRCFRPARARLGERGWRTAHSAGVALTPRQAVAAALQARRTAAAAHG